MTDYKNIKYAILQPLTGGAAIGTENAVGHSPEFMISYPGFDTPKYDKDGNLVDAGNEYFLLEYFKKHNKSVPYYQFDRTPFQDDSDLNPKLLQEGNVVDHPDYSNIDLVVAVPVCAGLSGASTASVERKNTCNNNMLYLAKYTLNVIKPKIYIFENAPRLMGTTGELIRSKLEDIAKKAGYSVAYYKTNTYWHDNCQDRPRTFVYFFRGDGNRKGAPELGFEHGHVSVSEFLSRIPSDATANVQMPKLEMCTSMYDYFKNLYGEEWRSHVKSRSLISELVRINKLDEWNEFAQKSGISDKGKKSIDHLVKHIYDKAKDGKGFYETTFTVTTEDKVPAAMFKTIPYALHYKEDRLYTLREWMSVMGMPYDFEMPGDITKTFRKIGQNVPARTMQFIASEAIKVIDNWDSVDRGKDLNVKFFDNNKQTSELMYTMN
jgi:site-specific DNA-cytosine methylase